NIAGEMNLSSDEVDKIKSALDCLDHDDYSMWFSVGAALHASRDARGYDFWVEWAEKSSKFDPIEQVASWERFNSRVNTGVDGIELEWIYKAAAEQGWSFDIDISDCNFSATPVEFEMLKRQVQTNVDDGFPPCLYHDQSMTIHNLDTLSAYVDENPTERFWNDGAFCAGSIMMVGGAPKVGKSKLILAMLAAASLGAEFMGHNFTRPLKCLWVQPEIDAEFLRERLRSLNNVLVDAATRSLFLTNFNVTDKCFLDLTQPSDLAVLQGVVVEGGYDIIALDPIANLSSADENSNAEVLKLLKSLEPIKRARCPDNKIKRTAIVMSHHMSKSKDSDDPFNGFRGASAWRGFYDSGIVLSFNANKELLVQYEMRNQASPDDHLLYIDGGQAIVKEDTFDTGESRMDTMDKLLREVGLSTAQIPVYKVASKFIADNGKSMLERVADHVHDSNIIVGATVQYCEVLLVKALAHLANKGDYLKLTQDGDTRWVN
ncbi:MAG: AAA family ATPase, partial [Pseudomonadales bacterium]